jgi:undecaprenyl-diphosphatase
VTASSLDDVVASVDRAGEDALDHLRGKPVFDRFFYGLSESANFSLIWHGLAGAVALVAPDGRRRAARLGAVLAVESLLVNQGVKRLFGRKRPAFEGEHPYRLRRPLTTSFPSGHSSAAFCAALLLSDGHRRQAPVWYAVAALVASSRVYVRAHHTSDVLAGAALGTGIGLVARAISPLPASRHLM